MITQFVFPERRVIMEKRTFAHLIAIPMVVLVAVTMQPQKAIAQNFKCMPGDKSVSGGYDLRGVREMASRIGLFPDGRFGYMLTVGAYDEIAQGCWSKKGATITLSVKRMEVNDGNRKFRRLILKRSSKGSLIRTERGHKMEYIRSVRF